MKNKFLSAMLLLLACKLNAQLQITNGARLVNSGPAILVLQDMNFVNNGILVPGGGAVKFTGSVPATISAVPGTAFNELIMAKTGNTTVSLQSSLQVNSRVFFESGLLELNQQELSLAPAALLENESAQSRITGINGGVVTITMPLNAPVSVNPGNLGAVISSPANLGNVLIRRGHQAQSGTGLSGSLHRYYDIIADNNVNLNAVLRLQYFDPELNAQAENALTLYKSTNAGQAWTNESFLLRNMADNYVEQGPVNSFSRWTLSSFATTLPVTGMEFTLQRGSGAKVLLQWKTLQESDNKGFQIERRLAHEPGFSAIGFIPSAAPGGNSYLPLQYNFSDNNTFKGTSYYRLRQEDVDGKFSYSAVRFVKGVDEKSVSIKVWPVPSNGEINISMAVPGKDVLQLFDMKGRLLRQLQVTGTVPVTISQLLPGTYFIRVAGSGENAVKFIVQ